MESIPFFQEALKPLRKPVTNWLDSRPLLFLRKMLTAKSLCQFRRAFAPVLQHGSLVLGLGNLAQYLIDQFSVADLCPLVSSFILLLDDKFFPFFLLAGLARHIRAEDALELSERGDMKKPA